jgi:hypothetical protein
MLSARASKLLEDTAQSVEQVHADLSERAEVLAAVLAELRALGAAELVEQWAAREAATTQALAIAGLERAALAAARARQQK